MYLDVSLQISFGGKALVAHSTDVRSLVYTKMYNAEHKIYVEAIGVMAAIDRKILQFFIHVICFLINGKVQYTK